MSDTATSNMERGKLAVDHSLTCLDCGYDLRALEIRGNCPECGSSIASSYEYTIKLLSPGHSSTQAVVHHLRLISIYFAALFCGLNFSFRFLDKLNIGPSVLLFALSTWGMALIRLTVLALVAASLRRVLIIASGIRIIGRVPSDLIPGVRAGQILSAMILYQLLAIILDVGASFLLGIVRVRRILGPALSGCFFTVTWRIPGFLWPLCVAAAVWLLLKVCRYISQQCRTIISPPTSAAVGAIVSTLALLAAASELITAMGAFGWPFLSGAPAIHFPSSKEATNGLLSIALCVASGGLWVFTSRLNHWRTNDETPTAQSQANHDQSFCLIRPTIVVLVSGLITVGLPVIAEFNLIRSTEETDNWKQLLMGVSFFVAVVALLTSLFFLTYRVFRCIQGVRCIRSSLVRARTWLTISLTTVTADLALLLLPRDMQPLNHSHGAFIAIHGMAWVSIVLAVSAILRSAGTESDGSNPFDSTLTTCAFAAFGTGIAFVYFEAQSFSFFFELLQKWPGAVNALPIIKRELERCVLVLLVILLACLTRDALKSLSTLKSIAQKGRHSLE